MPNNPGFQTFVNNELPLAVAGDFASVNPRASVLGNPFGYVTPPAGTTVGAMAWGNPATGLAGNYYVANSALGFVHREGNALITPFLGFATMTIPGGLRVTLFAEGDFWGVFTGGGTVGQTVYANPLTGLLSAAAAGGTLNANSTASSLATTGVLTVGATLTGTITVGMVVTGAGIPDGCYVSSQLTGTAGSTGTYQLTNVNGTAFPTVGSELVNFWGIQATQWLVATPILVGAIATGSSVAAAVAPAVGGILTVGTVTQGVFAAGQFITGGTLGATANAQILYQLSGTVGGAGTYQTNYAGPAVTSTTITGTAGQLGKISDLAL
jgi:hypothetical protein